VGGRHEKIARPAIIGDVDGHSALAAGRSDFTICLSVACGGESQAHALQVRRLEFALFVFYGAGFHQPPDLRRRRGRIENHDFRSAVKQTRYFSEADAARADYQASFAAYFQKRRVGMHEISPGGRAKAFPASCPPMFYQVIIVNRFASQACILHEYRQK
jgi:hypothetical protein